MNKSLLGDALALKRAVVVSTFRTVYSARPQENAGLLMMLRLRAGGMHIWAGRIQVVRGISVFE